MKRMNKKGFTLAELLIVIAIIAILIAIAIPAFGGALENAKLQADHANMRSLYSVIQTAKLLGTVDVTDAGTTSTIKVAVGKYYFNIDGTISKAGVDTNAYKTQAKHKKTNDACKPSMFCQLTATNEVAAGKKIALNVTADAAGNPTVLNALIE